MKRFLTRWVELRLGSVLAFSVSLLSGLVALCAIFVHFVEGWDWLDAVYFSVISLTTVGYGDLVPNNDATKIFIIFYLPLGISVFFIAIGSLGAKFVEMRRRAMEKSVARR